MAIRATALRCLALLAGCCRPGAGVAPARAARHARVPRRPFPVATDARLGGDDSRTGFVIDLTRKIEIAAFTLADPYRVVIDLPQVTFQLPARTGENGRGLVKAFRYGLVMQGGSRIVIDATGPVRIDKAFVLDAVDGQPARLVLDLVATDRASFMRNARARQRGRAARRETEAASASREAPAMTAGR